MLIFLSMSHSSKLLPDMEYAQKVMPLERVLNGEDVHCEIHGLLAFHS